MDFNFPSWQCNRFEMKCYLIVEEYMGAALLEPVLLESAMAGVVEIFYTTIKKAGPRSAWPE
ncbi:hypothetical protein [Burkholderia sp. PU8-34]